MFKTLITVCTVALLISGCDKDSSVGPKGDPGESGAPTSLLLLTDLG